MFRDVFDEFLEGAYLAGGLSTAKICIIESARLAVDLGDPWPGVLDSLTRNRPEWFSTQEALRRRRKALFQRR